MLRHVLPLALAALLLASGCASSQDATQNESRIALLVADINAAVDLTDTQAERIHDILVAAEANRPAGPPPRSGQGGQAGQSGPPPGGGRGARQAEVDRQIEAILTDEQVARYREWRASQPLPERPPRRGQ